ncbi:PREDICTED: syndetin-like isoform X1 [Tarenaya hassleriana]|uniref:syndetin-like isoform X1 n=2 Tax=Tarenaya hassleriana TaxID=28532 RepID=UPI00053C3833|nr:PREDICTED: syndetin-like isoform X1 [Tarenaya hassleriana]
MQPNLFPFGTVLGNPFLFNGGDLSEFGAEGFGSSRVFFLVPFLLSQGGGMDLSKVGEKIFSSVKSARSLGLLPSASFSDRPEIPARAAAAAAVARALAGLHPDQSISSSSKELSSIYGRKPPPQEVDEPEEGFYEEDFDPVRHVLENVPDDENDLAYFEKQAVLRLAQLDRVAENLSHHVMEHHEVMVKGMNLVRELERDLKIANVICKNGRRHLTSSMNEVSRDLIVNTHSKRKQALLDMLPILTELCHARDMQLTLDALVEEGNYCKAFQVLSEYLQLLDSLSEFSAIQQMTRGVEVWLGRTLHKLDSLLLGVCQEFKEESYLMVLDAYALIGDVSGLAEKIQSFFMQEVISETHSVLKANVLEENDVAMQNSRHTYSDLCLQIPEPKFRQCLLRTLAVLFQLICSYHEIMCFKPEKKVENLIPTSSGATQQINVVAGSSYNPQDAFSSAPESGSGTVTVEEFSTMSLSDGTGTSSSMQLESDSRISEARDSRDADSSSESPWYYLRKEGAAFVSETLQRGRRNLWQLTTSRVSVLLSSPAASSTSIHQFLKNYEDLSVFILSGEAFCGVEAVDFREKLKGVCENYFIAFHRQSMHALKMVLDKETWTKLPPDTVQAINFAGLVGDGAPLIISSRGASASSRFLQSNKSNNSIVANANRDGFSYWLKSENPFLAKLTYYREEQDYLFSGAASGDHEGNDSIHEDSVSPNRRGVRRMNGASPVSEDENEDLLADFIDEDSQLPSRSFKHGRSRSLSSHLSTSDDFTAQTGSSLCLLRSMDKYARLMQKLEIVNVEFFKGICQLFGVFFYFVFQIFGQENSSGKGFADSLNHRLKSSLFRISQDCEQWIKPQLSTSSSSSPGFPHAVHSLSDVTPANPLNMISGHLSGISFGLKERCASADTISLVGRILHKSKAHLQSMLMSRNGALVEDFFGQLVDSVPALTEHIHRTTARILLHVNGGFCRYVDRIANSKWEVKELGMEHNGYVDLMLGEFKHYKTRLAHGGIHHEVQNLLLEYGVEIVSETLVEGLSRVKRCTDEGRALMSLDLQVPFPHPYYFQDIINELSFPNRVWICHNHLPDMPLVNYIPHLKPEIENCVYTLYVVWMIAVMVSNHPS